MAFNNGHRQQQWRRDGRMYGRMYGRAREREGERRGVRYGKRRRAEMSIDGDPWIKIMEERRWTRGNKWRQSVSGVNMTWRGLISITALILRLQSTEALPIML